MPRRSRHRGPRRAPAAFPPRRGGRHGLHPRDDHRKRLVQRYYDEVMTARCVDTMSELVSDDFVGHDSAGATMDRVGYVIAVRMLHSAFSTLVVSIDDQIAEDDRVTTRWTAKGLHTGMFAGIAPTGREVVMSGIDIHRLEGDRLVELWEQLDLATLIAQLL